VLFRTYHKLSLFDSSAYPILDAGIVTNQRDDANTVMCKNIEGDKREDATIILKGSTAQISRTPNAKLMSAHSIISPLNIPKNSFTKQ
jgi:hypothetical protein